MEMRTVKPFEGLFVTLIFIFTTIWGLMYYWEVGESQAMNINGLELSDKDPSQLNGVFFFVNWILDAVSWISPFALIKGLMLEIVYPVSPHLYQFIDLFFLRGISWVSSLFTLNWAISKIPTESSQ